eukprot:TRINITY_DN25109_c0_g1_i1.p1 TRINITY_DN25109_c0_g1~~TRINITY_DN25109_c0_g1_i1.p1  ORF type:complete len:153 (+),score=30.91 TRINITY_DN25109_c0_g1_i1:152-610(+)
MTARTFRDNQTDQLEPNIGFEKINVGDETSLKIKASMDKQMEKLRTEKTEFGSILIEGTDELIKFKHSNQLIEQHKSETKDEKDEMPKIKDSSNKHDTKASPVQKTSKADIAEIEKEPQLEKNSRAEVPTLDSSNDHSNNKLKTGHIVWANR